MSPADRVQDKCKSLGWDVFGGPLEANVVNIKYLVGRRMGDVMKERIMESTYDTFWTFVCLPMVPDIDCP
jgi:hypothetical protein